MRQLACTDTLVVHQRKEWGEILLGLEGANQYTVCDGTGAELYVAAERGGCSPVRWFLRSSRPFVVRVVDKQGGRVLELRRPFFCLLSRLYVYDGEGEYLGTVQRRFALLERRYTLYDAAGRPLCDLVGPLFRPWTFLIVRDGQTYGRVTKEFGGLLTELFTEADTFGATFPLNWDTHVKALVLGSVFLLDFVHFEKSRRRTRRRKR